MFWKKRKKAERKLLVLEDPKSPLAEAFRNVRTNIQFANVESNIKTILVTSAEPAEGKSTVLANLAVAMAQAGQKVLVVDCDLRKPEQHSFFKINSRPGLTDLMLNGTGEDKAINATFMDNLSVIPSGTIPPNPSELLDSARFKALLDGFRENYDRVLLDSPPGGVVTDAVLLSGKVDGVILVVYAERTKADYVKQLQSQLGKAGANILGVVLNQLSKKNGRYRYYDNYYARDEDKKSD